MIKKLNIAYFGTPNFSANVLEKLIILNSSLLQISSIITQPDKPIGRKQILTPSPVKIIGQKYQIPVFETIEEIEDKLKEIDLVLVFAYGKIIPKKLLDLTTYGFWNIHPSLLPKYRGPSPTSAPLVNGDLETGTTLIKLDEKMDHGPIIDQQIYQILKTDTRIDLEKKLSDLGIKLFIKNVEKLLNKNINLVSQNENEATFTKILKKEDGFIEINALKTMLLSNQNKLFNLYKGLINWPGIWTKIIINNQEKRLKITEIEFDNELIIKKVQLEGKNEMNFTEFNKYYSIF